MRPSLRDRLAATWARRRNHADVNRIINRMIADGEIEPVECDDGTVRWQLSALGHRRWQEDHG